MSFGDERWVEDVCLGYFSRLGYQLKHGPDIGPEGKTPERTSYSDVFLMRRLRDAVARINPQLPSDAIEDVIAGVVRPESQNLLSENSRVHRLLTEGVDVGYRAPGGDIRFDKAWLIDFSNPENNDWLAVNQFTVVEGLTKRRADIVIFLNGIPLALLELKNPGDAHATLGGAFNQLQTYKQDIPSIFLGNAVVAISDGSGARLGTLTSRWEHFAPWKSIDTPELAPASIPQLEVLAEGVFAKHRFLDIVRNFIVFSDEPAGLVKRVAKYHQYWAVNAAGNSTLQAASEEGDGRAGVVFHTQGSGKSLEMLFYVNKIMREPRMSNPTIVVLTDRNDLDDQLFDEVFSPSRTLPESPIQAETRDHLRNLLARASGGIIFTTIQKFAPLSKGERYPLLTDRRNVVVVADEAHRSQYDFIDGFARHIRDGLPNATFIGFTGTPIEIDDRSTRQVFGDYVSIYDLTQAVEDGATVRIYYEARLAKVELPQEAHELLDEAFEEVTEVEEEQDRERLKSKWARLEAIVGSEKRLARVAQDIVEHWENRRAALAGKAIVVCMSRRICAALYEEIRKLRPSWHSGSDDDGTMKVVITGSASDPPGLQPHIRNKERLRRLKARAKNPKDELQLVIVRDMWLTGFDSPSLHTMYVDKAMRGHSLMQAIARVNRTFRDKPGGLVVDYLGIAEELRDALANYTERSREEAGIPIDRAVDVLIEKHEIVTNILHDYDWSAAFSAEPEERLTALTSTVDFILGDPDRRKRFMEQSLALSKAFALCVPHERALELRDDVAFFQAIRSQLRKLETDRQNGSLTDEAMETAIRQIVSEAMVTPGVIDLYAAAGIDKPDIAILSDEFLGDLQKLPQRNLQMEVLKKLLNDEIRSLERTNVVAHRRFSELLEKSVRSYDNRSIDSAQVIAELVELAKELRASQRRGEDLGLSDSELAFYDAVCQNDSAVMEMGDDVLKQIARELVATVKRNTSVDWTLKESVRAKLRTTIRRLLLKYDYPPDKTEYATQLVLDQAEALAEEWAAP